MVLVCLLATACAATAPPPKTPAAAAAPGAVAVTGARRPTVIPPVTLLPAATARPYQMATVSVGSFDRLLANGVKLVGSAVPIPMTPDGVRDMLLSEAGLAPEVAANLDLASPCGAAVVALDDKGRSGVVLAIPARGPAEAEKLIAALGKPVMTSGPLTMLADAAGKSQGWVYRAGSVVVLGDEVDAMARGTMLALEARHASADDATTTIYPEAIARAHGTDVKSAIAAFLEQMRQLQTAQTSLMTPDSYVYETFGTMLGLVGDAERIEIGLSLDPARGLILRARLMARPGTMLEAAAREVRPFEIDPAILGGAGAPVMIGAHEHRDALEADPRALPRPAGGGQDQGGGGGARLLRGLPGRHGRRTVGDHGDRPRRRPTSPGAFSTPLKDAATAAKVGGGARAAWTAAAMSALIRAQLGNSAAMFDWTAKRESVGKAKAMHFRMTIKKGSAFDSDDGPQVVRVGVRPLPGGGGDAGAGHLRPRRAGAPRRDRLGQGGGARQERRRSPRPRRRPRGATASTTSTWRRSWGWSGRSAPTRAWRRSRVGGSGPIPLVFTAGGDGAGKSWTMDLTLAAGGLHLDRRARHRRRDEPQ